MGILEQGASWPQGNANAVLAYYTSWFPYFSNTFVQREVAALQRQGVSVVTIANRHPGPNVQPDDRHYLEDTFYLPRVPYAEVMRCNTRWFLRAPFSYLRMVLLCLAFRGRPLRERLVDAVRLPGASVLAQYCRQRGIRHVHVHYAFGAATIALFSHILCGVPYSVSIHGSDVLLPNTLVRQKLRWARFVISNCEYHIQNLKQRYPELMGQRFHLVRISVDVHAERWQLAPLPRPVRPLRILNVARLEKVKAQYLLIFACARLRKKGRTVHCRIAGGGPLHDSLAALISELGLGEMVELLGQVEEDEISRQIAWSHVVVISSLSEGTPTALIEGMSRGRAVIGPDITAIPELIEHGVNGLRFRCGSSKDLAAALARLWDEPHLLKSMGLASRSKAEKDFDIARSARRLVEIFREEIPSIWEA